VQRREEKLQIPVSPRITITIWKRFSEIFTPPNENASKSAFAYYSFEGVGDSPRPRKAMLREAGSSFLFMSRYTLGKPITTGSAGVAFLLSTGFRFF